jgi:hypothetical protein
VRDATAKAMESDLKRIGLSNEQDLLDLERKYKAEERRLKDGIQISILLSLFLHYMLNMQKRI